VKVTGVKKVFEMVAIFVSMVFLYSVIVIFFCFLAGAVTVVLIWLTIGTINSPLLFSLLDVLFIFLVYQLHKKRIFKKAFAGFQDQIRRNL
jgi:hypothetical protein